MKSLFTSLKEIVVWIPQVPRNCNFRVFPWPFTHGGGGFVPPHMGGQVQGDKALMGTHEGGHRPYGGNLTLIDYIIN